MGYISDNIKFLKLSKASTEEIREYLRNITDIIREYKFISFCLKKYTITLEDIKANPSLTDNTDVRTNVKDLINDSNFEEMIQYLKIDFIDYITVNSVITPKLELLEKYEKLQETQCYADKISENNERTIKYSKDNYRVQEAIKKGIFLPTIEDLKKHPNLRKLNSVIQYVLEQSSNDLVDEIMKIMECNYIFEDTIIKLAKSKGYQITIEKIRENPYLRTSKILIMELMNSTEDIAMISELISLYSGNEEDVIDAAIDKGYIVNIEKDLKQYSLFSRSSKCFLQILNEKNVELIYKYKGTDEKVFQRAIDLGYKFTVRKILKHPNLKNSFNLCIKALDKNPSIFDKLFKSSIHKTKILDYALEKGYIKPFDDPNLLEELEKDQKYLEIVIKYYPNEVKRYKDKKNCYDNLLCIAIDNGYEISKEEIEKITSNMIYNTTIIVKALEKHPEYIIILNNISEEYINTIAKCINTGTYNPTEEELKKFPDIVFRNEKFMVALCKKDIKYFELNKIYHLNNFFETCANEGVFFDIQYIPSNISLNLAKKYFNNNPENFEILFEKFDNYCQKKEKKDFYIYSIDNGYVPKIIPDEYRSIYEIIYKLYKLDNNIYDALNEDAKYMIDIMEERITDIDLSQLRFNEEPFDELFFKIIKMKPDVIDFYNGNNPEIYKSAYENGINVKKLIAIVLFSNKDPKIIEEIKNILHISKINRKPQIANYSPDYDQIAALEALYPGLIDYLYEKNHINKNDKNFLDIIMGKVNNIDLTKIEFNDRVTKSNLLYMRLIQFDPNIIIKYDGENIEVFEKAIKLGANITTFLKIIIFGQTSIELKNKLIELLNIDFLKGKAEEINNYLENNSADYITIIKTIEIYPQFYDLIDSKYKEVIDILLGKEETQNFNIHYGAEIKDPDEVIKYLKINPYILKAYNGNDFKPFKVAIDMGISKELILNICFYLSNPENKIKIFKELDFDIPEKYIYLLEVYKYNIYKFIKNYPLYQNFMKKLGIDINKFEQYEFGKNYDWLSDIIMINEDFDNFAKVINYFFKYYYKIKQGDTQLTIVNSLENILKNYIKYRDLCLDIVDKPLNDEDITHLSLLFNQSSIKEFKNGIPTKKEDINNIENQIIDEYNAELESLIGESAEKLKDFLCKILFDKNYAEVQEFLKIYGTTENFKQLVFNNRNNAGLDELVYPIIIYTSTMESIIDLDDCETIINVIKNSLKNLKMNNEVLVIFKKIEDSIRTLFEKDINCNLTDLSRMANKEEYKNSELSSEYGVPVYDFSQIDYCLLVHVKSYRETYEDLIAGNAPKDMNNICLSAISYRNLIYYRNEEDFIFAYGQIPENSFCQSSIYNMGSNRALKSHSSEIEQISRYQRGILETSESRSGGNNEILCFREALKPIGIILIGGRKPNQKELEIAKAYNIPFIITQEYSNEIKNPKHAEMIPYKIAELEKRRENLTNIRDSIINYKKNKRRKIAIFTDLHGLFEPGLAILEDARKKGITEIYSLGDNIGTGPNPKEVIQLLKEYGVKSVKGNHEGYAIDLAKYEQHLISTGAWNEAEANSKYTRAQLSEEEMAYIESLPEDYTIEIGGKKILLTHYIKDYNTETSRYDLANYDDIYQGHVHFGETSSNLTTLKGAAIGNNPDTIIEKNNLTASYIIITETEYGYEVESVSVPYNFKETHFDIQTSELNENDKDKIERWGNLK